MTRIPRKIEAFNNYVKNSDDYLQASTGTPPVTNWQRLGVPSADATNWHDFRTQWELLFGLYSNVNTRTKVVTAEVNEAMDEFFTSAQPLLSLMALSPNATVQDAETLNFKIGRSAPSHPTQPIDQQCFVTLENLGGAMVKFKCKTATDATRAALPEEADSIMIAYKIGEVPPANADDGTQVEVITRASKLKSMGIENRGEQLYLYARWYNTHYPEFAGPWSLVTSLYLE